MTYMHMHMSSLPLGGTSDRLVSWLAWTPRRLLEASGFVSPLNRKVDLATPVHLWLILKSDNR